MICQISYIVYVKNANEKSNAKTTEVKWIVCYDMLDLSTLNEQSLADRKRSTLPRSIVCVLANDMDISNNT